MGPTTLSRSPLRPTPGYSLWLESLRGAACLAVVFFHAEQPSGVTVHPLLAALSPLSSLGWLGVTTFFVLSGYLIGQNLERHASSAHPSAALRFWRDRLLRIVPVFWAAWALSIALACLATPFNGLPIRTAFPPSINALLADLSLTSQWLDLPARLLVGWSLNHEIAFYLFAGLPLLFPTGSPSSRFIFFAALTALAHAAPVGTFAPLSLWPHFACGLAIAYARHIPLPRALRLTALAYPLFILYCGIATAEGPDLVASLSAYLICSLVSFESRLPAPPSALVGIGAASYSIYLIHVPIMSPLRNVACRFIDPASFLYVPVWFLVILSGLAAGILFHLRLERPWEAFRRRLSLPPKPNN